MTAVRYDPPTMGRSGIDSEQWKVEIDPNGRHELTGFGILYSLDGLPALNWAKWLGKRANGLRKGVLTATLQIV